MKVLFNDQAFFQGIHRQHMENDRFGTSDLQSAGKDLVVELSVQSTSTLDVASSVEINFGAGYDNWVTIPFTLSPVKYHLHRDGTLRLEPDTGTPQSMQVQSGEPVKFRTTLDQAILSRNYTFSLNLSSSESAPVQVHVQTESFE